MRIEPAASIAGSSSPEGRRIRERHQALASQLSAEIPRRTLEDTLILATWNIREFDSPSYGDRLPEALLFIAEILSRFDLIAVQEVREDLAALDAVRVLAARGTPCWKSSTE